MNHYNFNIPIVILFFVISLFYALMADSKEDLIPEVIYHVANAIFSHAARINLITLLSFKASPLLTTKWFTDLAELFFF